MYSGMATKSTMIHSHQFCKYFFANKYCATRLPLVVNESKKR